MEKGLLNFKSDMKLNVTIRVVFMLSILSTVYGQYMQEIRGRYIKIPIAFSKSKTNAIKSRHPPPPPPQPKPTTAQPNNGSSHEFNETLPYLKRGRGFGRGMSVSSNKTTKIPANNSSNRNESSELKANIYQGGEWMPEPLSTQAKHGHACNPTVFLVKDYCERAEYPHKDRMICASGDMENSYTCICKFRKQKRDNKNGGASEEFVQLRYNSKTGMCMSPAGGECYPRFPTGTFVDGDPSSPIYIMNVSKAHEQCDDQKPYTGNNKLQCAQAHPRRFSRFDQFKYYCLKKEDMVSQSTQLITSIQHLLSLLSLLLFCDRINSFELFNVFLY